VCIADVNVVKQVLFDRNGLYPKNIGNPHIARLLGKGLVLTDGDDWKRHRKVVYPAFNMDKLKVCSALSPDSSSTRACLFLTSYFSSIQNYACHSR
jgi:PHYB activation tagged suppressor 1